jgi:hypothetical protein
MTYFVPELSAATAFEAEPLKLRFYLPYSESAESSY